MTPYISDPDFTLYCGDALNVLRELPDESVHMCVTSPPYWNLRDYGVDGQLGLEPTPDEYVERMVEVFREVRRVLRSDGTCWLNIGDSYATSPRGNAPEDWSSSGLSGIGSERYRKTLASGTAQKRNTIVGTLKPKDLVGIPWRLAFALQADGWYLRADIIWSKPNPMPESVTDRPTKAHEYLFLLAKSPRYFYDADAIRETAEWARWGDQTYSPEAEAMYGRRIKPRRKSDIEILNGRNVQATNSEAERRDVVGGSFNNNPRLRENVGRNKRSVWEIATEPYPEAHFATFPTKLVEPCILAGTSERGCCPECGAPWERETEKIATGRVRERAKGGLGTEIRRETHGLGAVDGTFQEGVEYRTTGWRPTCEHKRVGNETSYTPAPCVVLDPFMGSGTVAQVARKHGRRSIGIELNPDYCALAAARLAQLSLLAGETAA